MEPIQEGRISLQEWINGAYKDEIDSETRSQMNKAKTATIGAADRLIYESKVNGKGALANLRKAFKDAEDVFSEDDDTSVSFYVNKLEQCWQEIVDLVVDQSN